MKHRLVCAHCGVPIGLELVDTSDGEETPEQPQGALTVATPAFPLYWERR